MISNDDRPGHHARRRLQAEAAVQTNAAQSPQNPEATWPQAAQEVLHELRVHQIELVMQNEELQQAQLQLDAARARYFELYDQAPVGYVSVSRQGRILQTNRIAGTLLGMARNMLVGRRFSRFVLKEDQDLFYLNQKQVIESGRPQAFELRMVKTNGTSCWTRLEATAAQDPEDASVIHIVLLDISERKRSDATILDNAERISALSRRLIEVQEEERSNLARELHDEIGQVLTAVRLNLKVMERQDTQGTHRDSLERALNVVEQAIGQVRGLSLRLRPPVLDDLGLVPALRWLVLQQTGLHGLSIRVEANSDDIELSREVASACDRIAQEALTNAMRHAAAAGVMIRVVRGADSVAVSVRDDGSGFDLSAERRRAGLGLLGMTERARLAGGTLQIWSEPGKGTEVRAEFGLGA